MFIYLLFIFFININYITVACTYDIVYTAARLAGVVSIIGSVMLYSADTHNTHTILCVARAAAAACIPATGPTHGQRVLCYLVWVSPRVVVSWEAVVSWESWEAVVSWEERRPCMVCWGVMRPWCARGAERLIRLRGYERLRGCVVLRG